MSEKFEPFKFECDGAPVFFSAEKDGLWLRCGVSGDLLSKYKVAVTVDTDVLDDGIRALLAERTRREIVFARAIEVATEIAGNLENPRAYKLTNEQLDALQREWEGT